MKAFLVGGKGACVALAWLPLLLGGGLLSAAELSGHYTNLMLHSDDSLGRVGSSDINRLRLTVDHVAGDWSGRLSYDHEFFWGHAVRDPTFAALSRLPQPTWVDATATIGQAQSYHWRHTLYRGWLQYERPALRLTVGRQRIAWGSGRIWNPTDRFNPLDPTAIEPDQRLGVDAVLGEWRYSASGSLSAITAPGRQAHRLRRKTVLRWRDTLADTDLALTAGGVGRSRLMGLDVTANLGGAGGRLEWMQSWGGGEAFGQLVTGLDYTLNNGWFSSGLYLALEYFYNGAAARPTLYRDRLQSLARQQLGAMVGYDLTPLWRLDLLTIADLDYGSNFVRPALTWSLGENSELTLFGHYFSGARGDFATVANLTALQLVAYF
ncbi:MAG: hypothetical protein R8J84_08310 [Mariprofundales bacterium]